MHGCARAHKRQSVKSASVKMKRPFLVKHTKIFFVSKCNSFICASNPVKHTKFCQFATKFVTFTSPDLATTYDSNLENQLQNLSPSKIYFRVNFDLSVKSESQHLT